MSHQPDNISAGTQVVSLVEVRGTGGSLAHPRGAVGVVTRTPASAGERHFLVRFPDGFEGSLTRQQFDVLKHFKDRLPGAEAAAGDFDLERLVIYRCVVGSRAYGLDNDESDTDRRGIYVAPAEMQWSLFGAPEQFEDAAAQACYWELQKFLIMALKANPNILECLHSPMVEKVTPLGEELLAMRRAFLSQMIFQTFNGYAMSQFKKIEQDMRNQGEVRWKHAMHLLRLLLTGAERILSMFHGPQCTFESAIDVLAEVTKRLWLEGALYHRKVDLLDAILDALGTNRPTNQVAEHFSKAIKLRLFLAPHVANAIAERIRLWKERKLGRAGIIIQA